MYNFLSLTPLNLNGMKLSLDCRKSSQMVYHYVELVHATIWSVPWNIMRHKKLYCISLSGDTGTWCPMRACSVRPSPAEITAWSPRNTTSWKQSRTKKERRSVKPLLSPSWNCVRSSSWFFHCPWSGTTPGLLGVERRPQDIRCKE
jgi:hypothetical protein